jgi:hypothetical protein
MLRRHTCNIPSHVLVSGYLIHVLLAAGKTFSENTTHKQGGQSKKVCSMNTMFLEQVIVYFPISTI